MTIRTATAAVSAAVTLGFAGFLGTPPAYADGAGYRVCNQTGGYVGLAYIYRSGLGVLSDSWRWQGYFEMEAEACIFFIDTHDAVHAHITVFAPGPGGTVGARQLGDGDFRASNRGAEVSYQSFCLPNEKSAPRGTPMMLALHGICDDAHKVPYSIYWTAIGQTHAEVNNAPHTLYLAGVGVPAVAGGNAPQEEGEAEAGSADAEAARRAAGVFDTAFDYLRDVSAPTITWQRQERCPVIFKRVFADPVSLDFGELDLEAVTFEGLDVLVLKSLAETATQAGKLTLSPAEYGSKTRPFRRVEVFLDPELGEISDPSEQEALKDDLREALGQMRAYCAAQE